MPQFTFNTVSRSEIERNKGGRVMLQAIDYNGHDNQIVTGVPGSGKTTVTLMRAERLIAAGKKIRVVTYQSLLATSLTNAASNKLKSRVSTFHKWYWSVCHKNLDNETVDEMLANLANEEKLDEILIDEGQDFEPRIFKTLLEKCSRLCVGADNAQRVHSKGLKLDQIESELAAQSNPLLPIRLQYNYRNTYEIYNFGRYFMPTNERANNTIFIDMMTRGVGNKPVMIQVKNEDAKFRRLQVLLDDSGDRNIAILLFNKEDVESYYNKLIEMGISCSMWHNQHKPSELENILITTYKSAKGMEFQVVIMPDMDKVVWTSFHTREHYYVGCTRAKESLFLLFTGDSIPKCFDGFDSSSYDYLSAADYKEPFTDDLPF